MPHIILSCRHCGADLPDERFEVCHYCGPICAKCAQEDYPCIDGHLHLVVAVKSDGREVFLYSDISYSSALGYLSEVLAHSQNVAALRKDGVCGIHIQCGDKVYYQSDIREHGR